MSEPDWEQIWKVERDICFLYHELSEYPGIEGDLAYGLIYTLPYWDFLNLSVRRMPDEERCFIRDGCLVMLLAMAWDVLDGSGSYLLNHLGFCQQAVESVEVDNEKTEQLVQTVKTALKAVEMDSQGNGRLEGPPLRHLIDLSVWVNREYVGGYFKQKANEMAGVGDRNLFEQALAKVSDALPDEQDRL